MSQSSVSGDELCSDSSEDNAKYSSILKKFVIVEEDDGGEVIETSLISGPWVIKYNEGDSVNLYWHPIARSQNQYFDAVRYNVKPRTANATVEDGRKLKLTWTKVPFKRIVFQCDDFRKAKQTWRVLSDASSPETHTQATKRKEKKMKPSPQPKYQRVSSHELKNMLQQEPGIRPQKIAHSHSSKRKLDQPRSTTTLLDLEEEPQGCSSRQLNIEEETQFSLSEPVDMDNNDIYGLRDSPPPLLSKEKTPTPIVSKERTPSPRVSKEKERRFSPRLREKQLLNAASKTQTNQSVIKHLQFPHGRSGEKNVSESLNDNALATTPATHRTNLDSKIDALLRGQRRMESTMATILKKINLNEERIDLLVKESGIELENFDEDFTNEISLPLKKEEQFKTLNEKLISDATFRNKFMLYVKKIRKRNENNPDRKIALEFMLEHFFDSQITDFGTWSGVRWRIEEGKKIQSKVFAFDTSQIFKIMLEEAKSLMNNETAAQHVIQEWIRNRASWRKKNISDPTKKRKIATKTRKAKTKITVPEDVIDLYADPAP